MIELMHDRLEISFPKVHSEARCSIEFQRTLRIPDDNREHHLPPGFGKFPLRHVDDFNTMLPQGWQEHGGVFLPMYQAEALWIRFSSDYPFAIKVAAGKINAITGTSWDNELHAEPQDYLVIPNQPWLDGFCVNKDLIRQFVAMPFGQSFTAEEQLTGLAEHGGIQIIAYPMKRSYYEAIQKKLQEHRPIVMASYCLESRDDSEMGLAPGGLMRQQIYEDKNGLEAWDMTDRSRCFVHILNSAQYKLATGVAPPTKPPTAQDYTSAGLPWFDYYDETKAALAGSSELAGMDSIAAMLIKQGKGAMPGNGAVEPKRVIRLKGWGKEIREGKF